MQNILQRHLDDNEIDYHYEGDPLFSKQSKKMDAREGDVDRFTPNVTSSILSFSPGIFITYL